MGNPTGPAPGAGNFTAGRAHGAHEGADDANGPADRTRDGSLRVAAVFSDHMVLQRHRPIAVFGTAPLNANVEVTLSGETEATTAITRVTHADIDRIVAQFGPDAAQFGWDDGDSESLPWLVWLKPQPGQMGCTLTVRSGFSKIEFSDVAIGEVWLASGQSNMELELKDSADNAGAMHHPNPYVRFYNVPKSGFVNEIDEASSGWVPANPRTVGAMSAVAYHFADQLQTAFEERYWRRLMATARKIAKTEAAVAEAAGDADEMDPEEPIGFDIVDEARNKLPAPFVEENEDVVIGIIDCYVGGTSVTCWMSEENLAACEPGRAFLARYRNAVGGKTDRELLAEARQWQADFDAYNENVATYREQCAAAYAAAQSMRGVGRRRRTPWLPDAANSPALAGKTPVPSPEEIERHCGTCPWPPPVTPFSPWHTCGPFEGMLSRVAPYTIAGVLWYQGEEDEPYADDYAELFERMIAEWRALWNPAAGPFEPHAVRGKFAGNGARSRQDTPGGAAAPSVQHPSMLGNVPESRLQPAPLQRGANGARGAKGEPQEPLPFLVVQLPQFVDRQTAAEGGDLNWPVLREAQRAVADATEGVSIISTMDCGEFDNVHPGDKTTVGTRLAQTALSQMYGFRDLKPECPTCVDVHANELGDALIVTMEHAHRLCFTTNPISVKTGARSGAPFTNTRGSDRAGKRGASVGLNETLSGFEVAGEDGVFHPAIATIVAKHRVYGFQDEDAGRSPDTVQLVVSSPQVEHPVAVRYAWHSWGPAPLFNGGHLPALPFQASI